MDQDTSMDLFFLGPKSEQRLLLKELVELVVDDYIFWRRNYHPKDPPAIAYRSLQGEAAEDYRARFHQELFELISDLKLDVPFFSPRYLAHMVSEVALPGLVAYLATMLYNPNNVSLEASPVTIDFELEVGRQLADLFGYDPETSFGHLCSGGTLANYESLWYHRAGKFLPLAIALACHQEHIEPPPGLPHRVWPLLNLPLVETEAFFHEFGRRATARGLDATALLRRWSIGSFGDAEYRRQIQDVFGETYNTPVVLVPQTAHYGWNRSAGLLGFGRRNLLAVATDEAFRMDPEAYAETLHRFLEERRPILQSVFVLGTTEFGSVDPLPELLEVRDLMRERGLDSAIHVDAAYGGYFASIFQAGEEAEAPRIPCLEPLRRACSVLHATDSVTVDPHKMGYSPYGAGGFVLRLGFLRRFVAQGAHYALDTEGLRHEDLGKFILEGSKPGAAAAAVLLNHRLFPLSFDGYGRHLMELCRLADEFHSLVSARNAALREADAPFRLLALARPETNIVCLLVAPAATAKVSEVDALNRKTALRFGVRDVESVQSYDYLVSKTRIGADCLYVSSHPFLSTLTRDRDSLTCLRLVFMNRWVAGQNHEGLGYLEDFLGSLEDFVEGELKDTVASSPGSPRSSSPPSAPSSLRRS